MPKDTDENPMLALGLNYVRFGQEEKNLFRFLFQTDKFGGKDGFQRTYSTDGVNINDMDRVPEWARAEKMERIVPLRTKLC